MKKYLAMLLALALVLGMLAGCGAPAPGTPDNTPAAEQEAENEEPAGEETAKENINGLELPLTDEKKTLTVLTVWESPLLTDPNEIKGIQAMEERTGVHIDWQTCGQTEMLERFHMVFSTGEYPDIIIQGGTETYSGGYEQGIEDGVLVDMDELLEYMPNYSALIHSNPKIEKEAAYDDGKFHGIKTIQGTDTEVRGEGPAYGITYRKDILDEMGEELPTTIDGWHDLLVKCRDAGMSAPMTLESDGGTAMSLAWGVNTDWSNNYWQYDYDTKKVGYGPMMPGFEDWLNTMRDWYAEDLIDKNFTAGNPVITGDYSNIENNETMLYDIWFGFMSGSFLTDSGSISNSVYFQGFPGVVLNEGDEYTKCVGDGTVGQEIYVTTACEDPILAAKWLDYLFTKESVNFRYYGIEGESYTVEDGVITYTDKILHPEGDLTPSDELSYYAMRAYGNGFTNFEAGNKLQIATSPNGKSSQIECIELWASPTKNLGMPGGVQLNTEENETIALYMTDIKTLVQEYMVKYIIGDDTTPYEEFAQKLKDYHIEDCIACYQAAADRYNAK